MTSTSATAPVSLLLAAKLHPDTVHIADANANGNAAESYTHGHHIAYPDGSGHSDTYCAGYRYAYCIAKLHTELHIHIRDRNDRAGNHRHRKPLR